MNLPSHAQKGQLRLEEHLMHRAPARRNTASGGSLEENHVSAELDHRERLAELDELRRGLLERGEGAAVGHAGDLRACAACSV